MALGIAACSSADESARGGRSTDGAETSTVTTGGARLRSADGRVSLLIPAGALESDTELRLTARPKSNETLSEIFEFAPDGFQFDSEATLLITIQGGVGARIARLNSEGRWTAIESGSDGTGEHSARVRSLGTFSLIAIEK